jgi:hypothetical protein
MLGSIVSALIGSSSASKAANAQTQNYQLGIESQERMFDKSLALQEPYRNAGYGAVSGLQDLTDPTKRAEILQGYYDSNEYSMMEDQAQQSTLRTASATGNLRGGAGKQAVANIAPQLGMQFLNSQQNQYTGLANMGMGAASQGANAANNLGVGMANAYSNIGDAQAQKHLTQGNIWGNLIGDMQGQLIGAFGGGV